MNKPYLYTSTTYQSNRAVIVLPEIFGITDFIKDVTNRFAEEFELPAFALDHFYSVTGKSEAIPYDEMQRGSELKDKLVAEDFMGLFSTSLDDIQEELPTVQEFIVVGFCFGGRLAWLSGVDTRVTKIISFYGGQPHVSGYYEGKSPIEALIATRKGDKDLKTLGFYGGQDESIPVEDRDKTKELLANAGIAYIEQVYDQAGHAYFNDARPERYNAEAAQASWKLIQDFLR